MTASSSVSCRRTLTSDRGHFRGQGQNGFGSYAPTPSDPNQAQVYRFFDATHGTEFLTASKLEADGLTNQTSPTYRPDLTPEPSGSFYEHSSQQVGDVAVYRFFDTVYGTHFYTGSKDEYAGIVTQGGANYRPDLTYEGVGFYAPSGSFAPATQTKMG